MSIVSPQPRSTWPTYIHIHISMFIKGHWFFISALVMGIGISNSNAKYLNVNPFKPSYIFQKNANFVSYHSDTNGL